jgi:hypothetical protein
MPCDRSITSAKAISPEYAIHSFRFQIPASSLSRKVIQQLLNYSSSPSLPLYHSFVKRVLEGCSCLRCDQPS